MYNRRETKTSLTVQKKDEGRKGRKTTRDREKEKNSWC